MYVHCDLDVMSDIGRRLCLLRAVSRSNLPSSVSSSRIISSKFMAASCLEAKRSCGTYVHLTFLSHKQVMVHELRTEYSSTLP